MPESKFLLLRFDPLNRHAAVGIKSQSMKLAATIMALVALIIPFMASAASPAEPPAGPVWVATWAASPQPVWGTDFIFPANMPAELRDQTVRQVARISLGGQRLRIVLSNAYGKAPLTISKAAVARATGSADASVAKESQRVVTFGGKETATVLPGASLVSDPVSLPVPALAEVAVSLYLAQPTPMTTFHWDGRQTSWIVPGDQTMLSILNKEGSTTQRTTARSLLTGIQVETDQTGGAIVAIGDSLSDGAAASLDNNSRWPDFLAKRLTPHGVAVVNAGISGARLLSDGMGVNALARLERDVLAQPGVRSVIVLLGINDIALPGTALAREAARPTLDDMKAGYQQLIEQSRSRGLRVIGATLPPFQGALPDTPLHDYYHPEKDALRKQVNDWIRNSGAFDAVIDFDAVLRDPAHPSRMARRFDSGDRLHPNDEGNRVMADAVNLGILLPPSGAVAMEAARRNPTTSSKKH